MRTFSEPRDLVVEPEFAIARRRALSRLPFASIDPPIQGLIHALSAISCCFTLQSCYGHFVYAAQPNRLNIEPLPDRDVGPVSYRIAYLALCLDNCPDGRLLLRALADLVDIDPDYVQFGSPDWFWEKRRNSYALQVEPVRFAQRDEIVIDHEEACYIETVRNLFFDRLGELVLSLQEHGHTA